MSAYTMTKSTTAAAAVYPMTRSQTRRYPQAPRRLPVPMNPQNATMQSMKAMDPTNTRA